MNNINFIDANAKCAIEYGEINGEQYSIDIEEHADYPYFKAFPDNIEIVTELGIEIINHEIKNDELLDELATYYATQTTSKR